MRRERADLPQRLEAELRKEKRQRDNFMALIAEGEAPASIVERIAALDLGIAEKERQLQEFKVEEPSELELRRLKATLRKRASRSASRAPRAPG